MANPGPSTTVSAHYLFDGNSTDGVYIAANSPLAFFGATPVTQPASTGSVTTTAAGSTTAVYVNTTFPGAAGSTAYTIGDIVTALKSLGLLKS
jgi:hypothetical protein